MFDPDPQLCALRAVGQKNDSPQSEQEGRALESADYHHLNDVHRRDDDRGHRHVNRHDEGRRLFFPARYNPTVSRPSSAELSV